MRNAPVIYIVVPCYNEEEVLPLTAEFLGKKLDDLTRSRRIHQLPFTCSHAYAMPFVPRFSAFG